MGVASASADDSVATVDTADAPLTARDQPGTDGAVIGPLPDEISRHIEGPHLITGSKGQTATWYLLQDPIDGFASALPTSACPNPPSPAPKGSTADQPEPTAHGATRLSGGHRNRCAARRASGPGTSPGHS